MKKCLILLVFLFFFQRAGAQEYRLLISNSDSLLFNFNKYAEAMESSEKIIRTFRYELPSIDTMSVYQDMADLYYFFHERGNNRHFISFLKSELDSIIKNGYEGNYYYFAVLMVLSRCYMDINNYKEAGKYFFMLREFTRSCNNISPGHIGMFYGWIGIYYQETGNMQVAKEYFIKSYNHRKQLYSQNLIMISDYWDCIYDLTYFYFLNKDYGNAIITGYNALDLTRIEFLQIHFMTLELVGRIHFKMNNTDSAYSKLKLSNDYYQLYRLTYHYRFGFNCLYLAEVLIKMERYEEAYRYIEQGLDVIRKHRHFNQLHLTQALVLSAELYMQSQQFDSAASCFLEAIDKFRQFVANPINTMTYDERKSYIKMNIAMVNKFYNFVLLKHSEYPHLVNTCYDLRLMTKDLGPEDSEKLANAVSHSDSATTALYEHWRDLRDRIVKLYSWTKLHSDSADNALDSLAKEADNIEKSLRYKISGSLITQNKVTTWDDIRTSLNEKEAAVEILRIENNGFPGFDSTVYAALIITKNSAGPEFVIVGNGKEMETKCLNEYKRTVSPGKSQIKSYSDFRNYRNTLVNKLKQAYGCYWEPIGGRIGKRERVYFSSDGVYHLINLNCLVNKTGRFLLEEKELVYLNSTKDLLHTDCTIGAADSNFALFGNPNYNMDMNSNESEISQCQDINDSKEVYESIYRSSANKEWQILKNTGPEVHAIAKILRDCSIHARVYTSDSASEANLRVQHKPSIMHIATHGYFDSVKTDIYDNPMLRSGLVMAGVNRTIRLIRNGEFETLMKLPDDGILTAFEALNLDLASTKLVVLSACQTGLGDIMIGDGVYGLQKAFKNAGAKNLIMSLWYVDDQSTRSLMQEFYKLLFKTKDVRVAFREAQLRLIRTGRFSLPGQWAPFVLISN